MISRLIFMISLLVVFTAPASANSFVQKQALKQFLTIFRDMQPSVLGAAGTGQLLAREMPAIMSRLRETRYAIANVGTDHFTNGASDETVPFAFIEDPNDRRTLIRYLDDYTYLLSQLESATAFNERSQIAEIQNALERKSQQIERLVGIWGRNLGDIGNGAADSAFLGCFVDQGDPTGTKDRDLDGHAFNSDSMTTELCRTTCGSRNFQYAGTQYGRWCFCGQSYGRSGAAGNCGMPCSGNSGQTCGGSWANSVYRAN